MVAAIPNKPAAVRAARELAETLPFGTPVRHRIQPERRGTVSAEGRQSIRIDKPASRGYLLSVFVAWEGASPSWVYADDLEVIAQPSEDITAGERAAIAAELRSVLARIEAAFDDDADKWAADKQLCLEDVESKVSALVQRIEAHHNP